MTTRRGLPACGCSTARQFRAGEPIYAFVGPSDVFNHIAEVSFWVDDPARTGPAFGVDTAKEFDLARTAGTGLAHPLESSLLSHRVAHRITALVVHKSGGSVVLQATITVADSEAHRLQVSAAADRGAAVDLDGAVLSGGRYVVLGPVGDDIAGINRVTFAVDGTVVRSDSTVDYDLVGNTSGGVGQADRHPHADQRRSRDHGDGPARCWLRDHVSGDVRRPELTAQDKRDPRACRRWRWREPEGPLRGVAEPIIEAVVEPAGRVGGLFTAVADEHAARTGRILGVAHRRTIPLWRKTFEARACHTSGPSAPSC